MYLSKEVKKRAKELTSTSRRGDVFFLCGSFEKITSNRRKQKSKTYRCHRIEHQVSMLRLVLQLVTVIMIAFLTELGDSTFILNNIIQDPAQTRSQP